MVGPSLHNDGESRPITYSQMFWGVIAFLILIAGNICVYENWNKLQAWDDSWLCIIPIFTTIGYAIIGICIIVLIVNFIRGFNKWLNELDPDYKPENNKRESNSSYCG